MLTYIINLERNADRRRYVEGILSKHKMLDITYINAFDGAKYSEAKLHKIFDYDRYERSTLKKIRPGEIGCTMSHQYCYRALCESNAKSAIIFEDDIVINDDNVTDLVVGIEKFLDTDEPRLLLLSGWYWFTTKRTFDKHHEIAKVYDGYLTHAYALNKAAAKILIDEKPWYVADSWHIFRKRGVNIYGLSPHPFDQDWSGVFKSEVLVKNSEAVTCKPAVWLGLKWRGLKQRILTLIGNFESPKNLNERKNEIERNNNV